MSCYYPGTQKGGNTCSYSWLKTSWLCDQDNPELALVQARWSFVNKDENLLTRLQNINLSFHFEVEQQVNGVFINFFGFNGTAGVWRITALEECGGWLERTTVEDMDVAVRAHLCGWKFIFLNDVRVKTFSSHNHILLIYLLMKMPNSYFLCATH